MRRIAVCLVTPLVLAGLLLGACGGDDGPSSTDATDDGDASAVAEGTTGADDAAEDTGSADAAAEEVPAFLTDFDRLCTTQVGFPGVASYDGEPGIHPIVLLEDFRDNGSFIESSAELPAGWSVVQDGDYEDNSDLAVAELVGCLDTVSTTSTGIECEFEVDDESVSLELVDAVYSLIVYDAQTGAQVGSTEIEATESECPYIASFRDGDTTLVASAADEDVINALKDWVAT